MLSVLFSEYAGSYRDFYFSKFGGGGDSKEDTVRDGINSRNEVISHVASAAGWARHCPRTSDFKQRRV